MAKRIQSRRMDGTFRRGSLTDVGLACDVCPNPQCRSFCPHKVGIEDRPSHCHQCGTILEWANRVAPKRADCNWCGKADAMERMESPSGRYTEVECRFCHRKYGYGE